MAKKRKKKRVIKVKRVLVCIFIVFMLIATVAYAILMPIKNIYIKGNKMITDNIIIEESQIKNYPSFLLTSATEIKKNLKQNPYINEIKIKKKLGNILEINIVEYKVIAITEGDNKVILSSGKQVENKYNITDAPILTNNIDEKIYKKFISKMSKINNSILRQISQIEYSPTNVDDSRFLLYMDDANKVYITLTKIEHLNKYNKIRDKMEEQKGIIYLDSGNYIELFPN